MIHELLFNLWNNSASVLDHRNKIKHVFELPQFLHPGEEELLQIIVDIAADYHKIVTFIKGVEDHHPGGLRSDDKTLQTCKLPYGLYLKAFCNGIRIVLEDYRSEILKLEKMFLENPQLSLAFVVSSIEKYHSIFVFLLSVIRKIETEHLHGCLLLNILLRTKNRGIESIEEAGNKIIRSINTVFYQHLSNWIVYGEFLDPYNEFFVCDGKVPDEYFQYPEQNSSQNFSSVTLVNKSKIQRPPSIRKFYINWNLLPMFISKESAENILFMGRIVWILRNKPQSHKILKGYKANTESDVWGGRDFEFCAKIQELALENFIAGEFTKTLEDCRINLTKYLWFVMLEEGNLVQHLKLIRDYYALGRGELFQQFLSISDSNLASVSAESFIPHINFIFQETARKIYGENDKSYPRFELTAIGEVSHVNPWLHLQLNFEISWPLHIVFHPEIMELYNKLFCYLLRLKKTQINLHNLWSNHMLSRQKIDRRVWMLRQNLMFLIDSLQYYMQVNVIEAQFSLLLKAVENASEFEDIIKVHHEFVTTLLAKTFVLSLDESQTSATKHRLYQIPAAQFGVPTRVYNVITKLLELSDEFCFVASTWAVNLTEADIEELEILQKKADTAIETLLFVLYSLYGKVSGDHLLQLILHLDFNRYFSRKQTDLNLTGVLNLF